MKIGAKSEKETRRAVEGQVLGGEEGGRLVELLREVAGHPSVEEGVRRRVEIDEFEYWKKLVGVLSCVFHHHGLRHLAFDAQVSRQEVLE